MQLFAVFETWHLGDGNYPPLEKGMLVNLSFEMEPDRLDHADSQPFRLEHTGDAEYDFRGEVLRVYQDDDNPLIVIACDDFRFYIKSPLAGGFAQGDDVSGKGTLALDHYIWVEFLDGYPDPPNLFYNLRVDEIKKIRLQERFITRSGSSISYPARVGSSDYGPADTSQVDRIEDEEFCHYVVRFSDQNLPDTPIMRTFI